MLVVLGGLPASGKSTIAAHLARELPAVHLRIDTIEQAMQRSSIQVSGPEGYRVACALAEDNLRLGHTVIADSVNPIEQTRNYWRDVARRASVRIAEIEVICSDPIEHRDRVESRVADIPGHKLPSWQQVLERRFEPWEGVIVIDTSGQTPQQSLLTLKARLDVEVGI